jgi:hypothetical protein
MKNLETILIDILEKNTYMTCKGNYFETEIYVDYRDELSESTIKDICESKYVREAFYESLDEWVMQATDDEHWSIVETIERNWDEVMHGNFDDVLDEIREWIHDNVYINFPYDHFLKTDVLVNVMVDTGDGDYDFTLNNFASYNASEGEEIEDESSILWLAMEQGYTRDDIKFALENYDKVESKFLKSLVNELTNVTSHMNALAFFVKMTLDDFIEMNEDNTLGLKLGKDTTCGLYDCWMGAGGMLEITLEKDVTISRELFTMHVDGSRGYGVQEIFGVCSSLWTNTITINEGVQA